MVSTSPVSSAGFGLFTRKWGEFCISSIISTVLLTKFLRNMVFSRNQNAWYTGNRCKTCPTVYHSIMAPLPQIFRPSCGPEKGNRLPSLHEKIFSNTSCQRMNYFLSITVLTTTRNWGITLKVNPFNCHGVFSLAFE